MLTEPDQFNDIREGVRAVCAKFPHEYHRKIDDDRAYSEVFVAALTKAGIAFGRLTDLEDLTAHPQNSFTTVRSVGDEIELMAPGFVSCGGEREYGPVSSLGQHDVYIRVEFGPGIP